jgi:hypothetical protein
MSFKRVPSHIVTNTVAEAMRYYPDITRAIPTSQLAYKTPVLNLHEWASQAACRGKNMRAEVLAEEPKFDLIKPGKKIDVSLDLPANTAQQRYCATCRVATECMLSSLVDYVPNNLGLNALYSGSSSNKPGQVEVFIKQFGGKPRINAILKTPLDDPRRDQFAEMTGLVVAALLDQPSDPTAYVREVKAPIVTQTTQTEV